MKYSTKESLVILQSWCMELEHEKGAITRITKSSNFYQNLSKQKLLLCLVHSPGGQLFKRSLLQDFLTLFFHHSPSSLLLGSDSFPAVNYFHIMNSNIQYMICICKVGSSCYPPAPTFSLNEGEWCTCRQDYARIKHGQDLYSTLRGRFSVMIQRQLAACRPTTVTCALARVSAGAVPAPVTGRGRAASTPVSIASGRPAGQILARHCRHA